MTGKPAALSCKGHYLQLHSGHKVLMGLPELFSQCKGKMSIIKVCEIFCIQCSKWCKCLLSVKMLFIINKCCALFAWGLAFVVMQSVKKNKKQKLQYTWIQLKVLLSLENPHLVAQLVNNLPAMRETQVQSLSWEDPLEKATPVFLPGEFLGHRTLVGYIL